VCIRACALCVFALNVCICAYVYMHMHVRVLICACICLHMHVCISMCTAGHGMHSHVCCVSMHVCVLCNNVYVASKVRVSYYIYNYILQYKYNQNI